MQEAPKILRNAEFSSLCSWIYSLTTWEMKAVFYPTFPISEGIWKGSWFRPSVLLVGPTCRGRWVWSIGGAILTGRNRGTGSKAKPFWATQFAPKILHGLKWDRAWSYVLRRRRLTSWAMSGPLNNSVDTHPLGYKNQSVNLFLNINQLDALNFVTGLFQSSTCFEHMCSS